MVSRAFEHQCAREGPWPQPGRGCPLTPVQPGQSTSLFPSSLHPTTATAAARQQRPQPVATRSVVHTALTTQQEGKSSSPCCLSPNWVVLVSRRVSRLLFSLLFSSASPGCELWTLWNQLCAHNFLTRFTVASKQQLCRPSLGASLQPLASFACGDIGAVT